ncbi:HAD family hydrolase [Streptomyces olivoreticuli]|uniref:HAD family hydrolase n=1 Tax=Streptomyces olivoreticuli TaxID=68246 RepID=UPI0013C35B4A|nr:HAD family hydrolase [Streptomyces olivoreticuli]
MADHVGLFDLDDTLLERRQVFPKWAGEFASEHGVPVEWLMRTDPAYVGRRPEFFEAVKTTFELRPSAADLHARYLDRMPELAEPDPDVQAMLVELRKAGWRLGVVTNGTVRHQMQKILRTGLYDLVDTVVISGEVGVHKPDARIFRHAMARIGAEPGPKSAMVGDSLRDDITGAQNAGLTTVWVSHGRPLPHPGPFPHHVVRTVTEAPEVFRSVITANR